MDLNEHCYMVYLHMNFHIIIRVCFSPAQSDRSQSKSLGSESRQQNTSYQNYSTLIGCIANSRVSRTARTMFCNVSALRQALSQGAMPA